MGWAGCVEGACGGGGGEGFEEVVVVVVVVERRRVGGFESESSEHFLELGECVCVGFRSGLGGGEMGYYHFLC